MAYVYVSFSIYTHIGMNKKRSIKQSVTSAVDQLHGIRSMYMLRHCYVLHSVPVHVHAVLHSVSQALLRVTLSLARHSKCIASHTVLTNKTAAN